VAQRLVNSGVVAVAGGYCSSASVPAAPIFGRAGVPFVLAASTNPVLTRDGNGRVFRTCGRDDRQGLFAARFVTEQLGARRVALLHDNTTYSKGLADATADALSRISGAQVVYLDALQPGQSDYTPVLTRIASTRPEVLYFTGYLAEAGLLLRQRQQLGLTFTLVGGDSTTDATVLRTAGATAEGFLATTEPLPNDLPSARDFVRRFKEKSGADPGPFSVYEYDAVRVVARAIGDAGSTKGAEIVKALHAIKDYQGVTGRIGFDQGGDRTGLVYITVVVRNGAFVGYRRLDDAGHWVDAQSA
jgi:branched-chain amino acid transport system substrate-binding protein